MATKTLEPPRAPFATEEAKWNAVRTRDGAADGEFFYSVKSTGVYCRPSCGARLPKRENVGFHASPDAAERAGFRACKRCRPGEPSRAQRQAAAVAKVCRLIEGAEELPGTQALADAAGMSRYHFHRVFKAVTGLTPKAYGEACRAARVRAELEEAPTVTDAIYGAGYGSNGRFYAKATKILGMTPTEYRGGGAGATIRFGVGECSLGAIAVAASQKGICAILLGGEADALVRDLEDRFPNARLVGGDGDFESWMAQVVGLVEAPRLGLSLPLDIQGTAFQQRVWQALQQIPPGMTASYAEIARQIGAPGSARAVARACAANAIAIAIPCHRVVRADGGLSGYRWGVERKRALLEREARA